jgi:hypothetical protein
MASKPDTPGAGKPLLVRVRPPLHKRIEAWIRAQPPDDLLTFPEALRRLADIGMSVSPSPASQRRKAEKQRREAEYNF